MRQTLRLMKSLDGIILLKLTTGKSSRRLLLTEHEAQHLSNRLQAYAKSQGPLVETIIEIDV